MVKLPSVNDVLEEYRRQKTGCELRQSKNKSCSPGKVLTVLQDTYKLSSVSILISPPFASLPFHRTLLNTYYGQALGDSKLGEDNIPALEVISPVGGS